MHETRGTVINLSAIAIKSQENFLFYKNDQEGLLKDLSYRDAPDIENSTSIIMNLLKLSINVV